MRHAARRLGELGMERLTVLSPWRSAALSHCGQRHQDNQDSCLERPDAGLWAVADGMGGHADGHIASRTVCHALARVPAGGTLIELDRSVHAALEDANAALVARAATKSPCSVIGSTAAVLMIRGGYAVCAWCGDSRIHLVRGDEVFLLTRDHSVVQEMVDRGEIDHATARVHRDSHIVARAVGVGRVAELDRLAVAVRAGDRFLLCTDGVSRHVAVDEMAGMVTDDPDESVRRIVDLAQARGATDDVTAVAVVLDGIGDRP